MNTIPPLDADLLRRYDQPGPRYTSYPTAPQFATRVALVLPRLSA